MLYSTDKLKELIKTYLENEKEPTPRHFRAIGLKLSKQDVSNLKTRNKEQWDLIKSAEDLILAQLEKKFTYGGKEYYNCWLTLRAYDKEQYIPELTNNQQEQTQIVIDSANTSGKRIQIGVIEHEPKESGKDN